MTTPTLYLWLKPALLILSLFLLSACGGGSTTASGTITAGNAAPVAADVSGTVDEDTAKSVTLPGTDADGNALTYSVVTPPTNGAVTVSGGIATYTPDLNYHGADSFTYKANDGTTDSAIATVSITVTPVNDLPTANAGTNQTINEGTTVTLNGGGLDVDGDTLTYSWAQTGLPAVTLNTANTATATFTAPAVTADTTLNFTLTVSDGNGGTASANTSVVVSDATVQPSPTSRLNDTGITECGYLNISTTANGLCPQLDYPAQDGDSGRDVTADTNSDTDGHAGFSFTKLDANGVALAIQSEDYDEGGTAAAGTKWSCIKDNVTGLIWEVKTDDGGLQDKDDRYNWYSTDTATNGGSNGFDNDDGAICFGYTAGNAATYCNTEAYVNRVNATGLCGANSGWRLPNVTELRSIVDLSRNKPSIDPAYFPNTAQDWYWVGTPDAADTTNAMNVSFQSGAVGEYGRSKQDAVRLVRSSQ